MTIIIYFLDLRAEALVKQGGCVRNLLICLLLLVPALSFADESPTLRYSNIDAGYIPDGFDSNDNVQVVVEGVYRDTCSKPAGSRFKVNPITKNIEVVLYEYRYEGLCLDVLVPHDEVINLGVVTDGQYKVIQSGGRNIGVLNVVKATKTTPDDYLYAPVAQAYLKSQNGKVAVTISGVFTNSCMKLRNIIPKVQPKVIAVAPIAELEQRAGVGCVNGSYPFEQTILINNVKPGRYLLHVRSLNGKAVNNLFDVN